MFLLHCASFLVLLASIIAAGRAEDSVSQCPAHGPCRKAFLTDNPMTLQCGNLSIHTPVFWQFLEANDPYTEAVTFISSSGDVTPTEGLNSGQQMTITSLMSRTSLISGELTISSPKVADTGLYICKDGETTLASYQIDFQDASRIHVSHDNLMQNPLWDTSIDLGEEGTLHVFTIWSDWQPCDRCRSPGERKRIGYCYGEVSKDAVLLDGPLPCGLLRKAYPKVAITRPPELMIETCRVACRNKPPVRRPEDQITYVDNYHTVYHGDVSLTCPQSSIYKPVYWTHGTKHITRLQQMLHKSHYMLDNATGGGVLSIHMINMTERGDFNCYVDRQLVESFKILFPVVGVDFTPKTEDHMVQNVIIGVGAFVVAVMFVTFIVVLCKSTQRVIH